MPTRSFNAPTEQMPVCGWRRAGSRALVDQRRMDRPTQCFLNASADDHVPSPGEYRPVSCSHRSKLGIRSLPARRVDGSSRQSLTPARTRLRYSAAKSIHRRSGSKNSRQSSTAILSGWPRPSASPSAARKLLSRCADCLGIAERSGCTVVMQLMMAVAHAAVSAVISRCCSTRLIGSNDAYRDG